MSEREQLERTIAALEAQRDLLDENTVEALLASLRARLAVVEQRASSPVPPPHGQPDEPDISLEGERRLVTILFADVSGPTTQTAGVDPEVLRDLINAFFEQLAPIIERYEGTLEKFVGTELLAIFGAPVTHENDPERAVRAAMEMREAMTSFSVERDVDLALHVGINTGLVIAGNLGTHDYRQYGVMGDAVNLAARLAGSAQRGEILVGVDSHRLTASLFEFESLGPIRIKGKTEPVPVFRLLAPKTFPSTLHSTAGLDSPLVGREREFHALQTTIEELQAGRGGIVTLVGEAGLGKSRLVAEIRKTVLPGRDHPRGRLYWVEGRCLSHGTTIPYLLWLNLLRGLLGVTTETAPTVIRDRLREWIQTFCPQHTEEVYLHLGRLMSLPLETEATAVVHDLEGKHLKSSTHNAIKILTESAARQRPLVVVCEDLHWADPTSIELLEELLPLIRKIPLIFLCVFRPQKMHGCWRIRETAGRDYSRHHLDLWLDPLSATESETLVGNLLRLTGRPETLAQSELELLHECIFQHTEGNPFYVEEIIRSLIDGGALVQDEVTSTWRVTHRIAQIAIPSTLHGVLMARIDSLPEKTRQVLHLAAVIGRIFPFRVLAAIAATSSLVRETVALEEHLQTLQREEMIRERAQEPELTYIFKHHLTQDAAYNALLKRNRRALHREVAQTLEKLFPERLEEQVEVLAHHWEQAEEPEKATVYLLRAGDHARLSYTPKEAISSYQRALALLSAQGKHEQAARTLMKLGLTYHADFDFRQAHQAYEQAFVLWQRARESPERPLPPAPHALRVNGNSPTTLDPGMAEEITDGIIVDQLFSGLVRHSPEMDVVPEIARSWEVLEKGRQYIFTLRDDVRWSDDTPVTARDFEYAWKRVLHPATNSPLASLLYDVKGARSFHQGQGKQEDVGIDAPDDVTLVVELEGPTGHFLHLLTYNGCYPVPRHVVEACGQRWTEMPNLVTNGPFQLASWKSGQSLVLVRNPAYRGPFAGNLQRVEISLVMDPSARWQAYEAGETDVIDITFFPPAKLEAARQRYAGEYVPVPRLFVSYLAFDVTRPPFDDVRVRQAFALSLDRETLVNVVLGGFDTPATGGIVPPGMPGHSPGIGLPYDPERARQLLAEAGYPEGRGFPTVDGLIRERGQSQYDYLQTQWRQDLGVDVTWEETGWTRFLDRVREDPPHVFLYGWVADYPDPDNFLRVCVQQFQPRWLSKTYTQLVEEARRVTDQEKRMQLYRRADRLLVEQATIVPLTYWRSHLLVKPWVRQYPTSAIKLWFWKDVVIEPHEGLH